jgi:hypothetical protein
MATSTRASHGIKAGTDSTKAGSQSQAMWRFLNNDSVKLTSLIEPLQQAAREGCADSQSRFVLVMHDWCKIDFKRHTSKKDLLQVTHEHDIGYDLTTSLAVHADHGGVLAPVAMHLRTGKGLHSTAQSPPKKSAHHLNQLEPTMDEIGQLDLGRTPVHIIDREADSLGHLRAWSEKGHLFLVRCDDRRVKCDGESVLLSEINEKLDRDVAFQKAGRALYHGKKVKREVAEVDVVLDGVHKTRVGGKQREIAGKALALRAVFVRLVDKEGYILAEWMLLTNVPACDADTATIGQWYYYRWRIESYFKLLKSAGYELEHWQQTSGKAILRRLLIASMACVFVWQLRRDKSEQAATLRAHLMKLSGRLTKHGVESTATALLAGWYSLLAMFSLLETQVPIEELRKLAKMYVPPGFLM